MRPSLARQTRMPSEAATAIARASSVGTTRTPTSAISGQPEVGPAQVPQPAHLADLHHPGHGDDHDGAQGRLGQRLEQRRQEQRDQGGRAGRRDEGGRRLRPGPVVRGRLRERRPDREPREQAGARVGGADRDQLPVGVDLAAMLPGELVGRTDGLGEGDEGDPDGTEEQQRQGLEPHAGQRWPPEAGGEVAHDVDAPRSRDRRRPTRRWTPGARPARPGRGEAVAPAATMPAMPARPTASVSASVSLTCGMMARTRWSALSPLSLDARGAWGSA